MFSKNLKTTDKADLIQMNHKPDVILGPRHKEFLEDAYLTMVYKSVRYYATCYRTNYGADNDLLPSTLESTDLKTDRILSNRKTRTLMDRYLIYMISHEMVTKMIAPGAMLAIHDPFDPSFDPHILEPGKHYRIFIRMEQEKLLPYPYATDCRNYTEEWISNNKTGPKSKEMLCAIQHCYVRGEN
ncbi:uncharacterized protein LOC118200082 [Stegodyphus dumicola]|uniref:uncharacterized protein LOC118200082 n=1 Tax=Stegodyphus dumicola TaxID=202533 RepID=UPI0015B1B452|nr:uncharacterized protein LOC118200082 [Stegodyphus dumicola]XP_035227895.1 uncharacterized protein LOC118200082 [Stegodyphus dumicola]